MQINHSEVQDFCDEDKKNYETEEIEKGNKNKLSIFIADQNSENKKQRTKYGKQSWYNCCGKKAK